MQSIRGRRPEKNRLRRGLFTLGQVWNKGSADAAKVRESHCTYYYQQNIPFFPPCYEVGMNAVSHAMPANRHDAWSRGPPSHVQVAHTHTHTHTQRGPPPTTTLSGLFYSLAFLRPRHHFSRSWLSCSNQEVPPSPMSPKGQFYSSPHSTQFTFSWSYASLPSTTTY